VLLRQPTTPTVLAWLVIIKGPDTGRMFQLSPESAVIGRDATCDIPVDDSAASRQHAKLRMVVGDDKLPHFLVHDLASGNGTLLNDVEMLKGELRDGDTLTVGRTEMVFKQVLPRKRDKPSGSSEDPEED
jgi:pSer/pThr/pTyr-binding forkhead associated (FHA) protein